MTGTVTAGTTLIEVLGAVGGVAVVAGGVAAWVSNHLSSRWLQTHKGALDRELETHRSALAKETEDHKLKLKRQEMLFQRELEAADAFMALWRKVWPQYSHPEMEWLDACEDVAVRLGSIEQLLEDYLERHSVAISSEMRDVIDEAKTASATEKFFDEHPPREAIAAGERVLNAFQQGKDQILADLRR